LHGKFVVVVAKALGQPQDLVTTWVVTHPGTRHVRQAVPVDVSVGQFGAGAQFWTVVVHVVVSVLTSVVVWMRVAVTLMICVTTLVWIDVVVVVWVVGIKTVLVVWPQVPVAPGLVQMLPRQIVVGVTVTCPTAALQGR
jgi:hypothetical protein